MNSSPETVSIYLTPVALLPCFKISTTLELKRKSKFPVFRAVGTTVISADDFAPYSHPKRSQNRNIGKHRSFRHLDFYKPLTRWLKVPYKVLASGLLQLFRIVQA